MLASQEEQAKVGQISSLWEVDDGLGEGEERALIESKENRYSVRAGGAFDIGTWYVWC
jgi:hypothetical protein